MPFLHGKVWRKVRAVRVGGFRYVVYYVVFRDRIDVIAVMHGARRAAAWMSRA
jgi:plasmid stabilization system protein ParE